MNNNSINTGVTIYEMQKKKYAEVKPLDMLNVISRIEEVSNNILDSKFDINPKFYDKENISCKFCSFQDICYMRDSNLKYLSKAENLDFLGGEE